MDKEEERGGDAGNEDDCGGRNGEREKHHFC